ncbi:MAG: MoxR family ATPase [Planctomycetota bacterium]|nr:MoxR family ATPase [Planctomycetota bacterium]
MPDVAAPPRRLDLPSLDAALDDIESVRRTCAAFREVYQRLRAEIGKVIVGQEEVVDQTLTALFADGHVLLEGVPGLGKTLLVRTLGWTLSLPFARIQFTPDVMPADITGTSVVVEDPQTGRRSFSFRPGPLFHQLILADEVNRATPKSQSALLEAMQERSVSIGGETRELVRPFLVMATQNPIEQEGTYQLPEAQLDRFFFKIAVPYTTRKEMNDIVGRTTTDVESVVEPILDGPYILEAQRLGRRIVVAPHVRDFAIRLVLATHPTSPHSDEKVDRYIAVGVSPRGVQAIICAAKIRALVDGRYAVAFRDIIDVARPALRHRIMPSFEAEADGVSTDDVIGRLIEHVPREGSETSKDRNVGMSEQWKPET